MQTETENEEAIESGEEEDVYNFEEDAEPEEEEEAEERLEESAAAAKKTKRKARSAQYPCGFCSYTTPKR